jgi:anti-anti-sigma regulatory factor
MVATNVGLAKMLNPSVEVRECEGVLVAEFWDCLRLDPNPIRNLRIAYERHAQLGGRPAVVVDMKGVGFAGSAALGGFVALRKAGARVVFFNTDSTVREVFRVSKLEPLFQFADDQEGALRIALASNATSEPADSTPAQAKTRAMGRAKTAAPPLRRVRRASKPEADS